jgi:hypothetical protein
MIGYQDLNRDTRDVRQHEHYSLDYVGNEGDRDRF